MTNGMAPRIDLRRAAAPSSFGVIRDWCVALIGMLHGGVLPRFCVVRRRWFAVAHPTAARLRRWVAVCRLSQVLVICKLPDR